MYEEELRNLQNNLNQKDKKISQLEKEQQQLYKKYKSLKGKSKGNLKYTAIKHNFRSQVGTFRLSCFEHDLYSIGYTVCRLVQSPGKVLPGLMNVHLPHDFVTRSLFHMTF